MAASTRRSSGPVMRSLSPAGKFYSPSQRNSSFSSTSSAFASSTSGFSTGSHAILHRSTSPNRVNLYSSRSSSPASSIRFSLDRSTSPSRSISAVNRNHVVQNRSQKKSCMCSPTTHPGSFRCSLHKNRSGSGSTGSRTAATYSPNQLILRRSAMTNSLVRIGTVEGDLVKRALAALIRPSSHQQRRRADFQRRPSRLSAMSKADDS
ncbi:hypothetical protein MTR67_029964 [Solanum verrucosum]|uniref:Serine-rich protein-like protein n=2 Tax=Solanum TaxID=4107 RepID=A0AAF0TY42_SOLVR|nr:uncharacterized protein LOC125824568 [Solanum verrucosum]WMV36579.1 hypothetical protein MTR67_029964 [Solanum verrucosum]